MNLLLYDACTYTQNDIMDILNQLGIHYKNILYKLNDLSEDDFFTYRISRLLSEESYDAVFSTNYYPILAKICNHFHIKYIAWSYDSPLNIPDMEETLGFETNYVFFFDRMEYEKYRGKGFQTVYYMPLGVNSLRLKNLTYTKEDASRYSADISFVGQLYESTFSGLILPLSDYDKGYLNGIIETQLRVYGYYFIEDLLTDDLLERMNQCYRNLGQTEVSLQKYGLACTMAKQVTRMERLVLLNTLGEMFHVKLYSGQFDESLSHLDFGGSVNYYTQMPKVFNLSKINLNPTLKCIRSAIPLRALDILASGGFLLSNFQPELAEYFENEKEVVLYDSLEDAVEKAAFYLAHEDFRSQIAQNGMAKVHEEFSYRDQLTKIFQICSL